MTNASINRLLSELREGEIDRRGFLKGATALGISAGAAGALARTAGAQDATPEDATPEATPEDDAADVEAPGEVIVSMTRDEYLAELEENHDFTEPEQMGGTFIHTGGTDIQTLNPILQSDVYSGYFTGTYVFDGIVATHQVTGELVPGGLVDYWEIAEDGVTYTFHLFEDNMWHDGTPLTAHDCVFSYDSTLAEDSLSVRRAGVEPLLESYRAVDDHTFEMVSDGLQSSFIFDTANQVGIVPQHIWEDIPPAEWGSDPGSTGQDPERVVGSGPFRFVSRTENDNVTVERNEDYRDPDQVPNIDQLIYQVVVEDSSRVQALQTGDTDVIQVPVEQADSLLETSPELNQIPYDTTSFTYYFTNQNEETETLFLDERVRQALHYALDRELIVEQIYQGYATAATGTQPVLSIAYRPDEINTIYSYDPDRALELFEEAGWTPGDDGILVNEDGDRMSFECMYSEGSAVYTTLIPYIQQAWEEVGVEMFPSSVPLATLLDFADESNFQMGIAGFSWGTQGWQGSMFECDRTPPGGFNRQRYCNEEFDELLEMARLELDEDARIDILTDATNILNDEMAAGILVFSQTIAGVSPRVQNYFPNGYSMVWSMNRVWLSD